MAKRLPTADTIVHTSHIPPHLHCRKRSNAGRPKGSTNKKKKSETMKEAEVKYRITCRYLLEVQNNIYPNYVPKKQIFERVFKEEKHQFRLKKSFKFPYNTAISRIKRNSLNADGTFSPLYFIEDQIVQLCIVMSKLKSSLSVSEGLSLVNELIENTPIQQSLIDWKKLHNTYHKDPSDLGKVGHNYWLNFIRRKGHLIRSKSGKKYAIDRSNFTTYLNFRDMYDHIEDVLVNDYKVARKFDVPVWMNSEGKIVEDQRHAFGCKVTIDIHRPDMCIVFDEVGCNITQEKDGSIGGKRFICAVDEQPYQSCSTKTSHFTCLGLTRLDGEALMCVVIIQGKKRDIATESGIDWNALSQLDIDDIPEGQEATFFINNFGKNKVFPGGPSCFYKGKEVPAFITFSEGGGINGNILTEIFQRLDKYQIYDSDRKKGLVPFVLIDGHHSRFELSFLQYINDPKHRWNVCIGVPYGTAFWQVADTSYQNGKFKMTLNEEKATLFHQRKNTFQQNIHLLRTDTIPLVNSSWPPAFANVQNNRKAILETGWRPYNRNLLLSSVIRASMTEEMLNWEKQCGLFSDDMLARLHNVEMVETNGIIKVSPQNSKAQNYHLNFNGGITAQHVSNTLLSSVDRQKARERLQKMKEEGSTKKQRLDELTRKITAAKMTLDIRQYILDDNIYDHVVRIDNQTKENIKLKRQRMELGYMKLCHKADEAFRKNDGVTDLTKWKSKADIQAYLKPLKEKDDSKMPNDRDELNARYYLCRQRNRRALTNDTEVISMFDKWLSDENDKKNRGRKDK